MNKNFKILEEIIVDLNVNLFQNSIFWEIFMFVSLKNLTICERGNEEPMNFRLMETFLSDKKIQVKMTLLLGVTME